MHLKASIATQRNITATHDSCPGYFMNAAICGRKAKTSATKSADVEPTEMSTVE